MNFTTRDHTISNGSTRAGASVVKRDVTEIFVDGALVDTIVWSAPLLRRLDREGRTRANYIEQTTRELSA